MEGREIRESFLRFFEERGHKRVPSSSLIPPPESGLLLTNAGMNQFIPYFLGHAQAPFPRAVTAQKVFRALDIDNVGHTARHLTLFEMLGNFSFGDYFKKESCAWGLELVTQVWGIDRDRIWVTVFETDDETVDIWNHVFMQDQVDDAMSIVQELPAKNIDTGSSLERVAMVLQDVDNIFETDLIRPLLAEAESVSGRAHGADDKTDVSLKVIAEHGRATAFLIADGVQPSNEGRGYILRRMLRRVVSHARRLGVDRPVMQPIVSRVVDLFGEAYPELIENRAYIERVATSEEERFASTLRQGMTLFEGEVGRAKGRIEGDVVFKLHDTYGFPKELTRELAEEQLAEVAAETGKTEFVGYERLESDGRLVALLSDGGRTSDVHEGQEVRFVLDRTPFYAESGGQIGDQGIVRAFGGVIRVTDAQFGPGDVIVHTGVVDSGEIHQGEEIHGEVDVGRREATARSHTATHIVHWTLRHIVGEHARQAGSLVAPGRLRFDFPHHSSVPRDVLEQAEELANSKTADDDQVTIYETTFDEAKNQGAIALFGEKYGDFVRVVEVGDYSVELCGGTHVHHTGHVGTIRLLGERSIGAGMRRVEAVVGPDALREINLEREWLQAVAQALGTDPTTAAARARQLVGGVNHLESAGEKEERGRGGDRAPDTTAPARGGA